MSVLFLKANGIRLHYRVHGSDSAEETLILVHGLGLNVTVWDEILPYLDANYRIVTFDLRGHGQSEWGSGNFGWETLIEDIERLRIELAIASFHMIGYGLGANLAITYSLTYEDRVKSMVLLTPVFYYPKALFAELVRARKSMIRSSSMEHLALSLVNKITELPVESHAFQEIVAAYANLEPEHYLNLLKLYMENASDDNCRTIKHRTLTLVGDKDRLNLATYAFTFKPLHLSRLLIVPQSSSAVFLDQPAVTADWMVAFIKESGSERTEPAVGAGDPERHLLDYYEEVFERGKKDMASKSWLQANFISGFQVSINGEERSEGWNQRYAKSLLLFLVLNRHTTREQICDELFPDKPLKQALNNLKVYLNHLKKLLEASRAEGHDSTVLLVMDKENIRIEAIVQSDITQLLDDIRAAQKEDDPTVKLRLCRNMMYALPSELMPGLYDDWIIDIKNSVESQIVDLAMEAADLEEKRGNARASIQFMNVAYKYQPERDALLKQALKLADNIMQAKAEEGIKN